MSSGSLVSGPERRILSVNILRELRPWASGSGERLEITRGCGSLSAISHRQPFARCVGDVLWHLRIGNLRHREGGAICVENRRR